MSSPSLPNDPCDNVIISPPLEFVDSLQTSSSKPKTRTAFISDVLHLPGDGDLGGDLSSDSDPVPGITQHLYTTLLAKLVTNRERLTSLAAEYERLSRAVLSRIVQIIQSYQDFSVSPTAYQRKTRRPWFDVLISYNSLHKATRIKSK